MVQKRNDISNVCGMCNLCAIEKCENWCLLFVLSVLSPSLSWKPLVTSLFPIDRGLLLMLGMRYGSLSLLGLLLAVFHWLDRLWGVWAGALRRNVTSCVMQNVGAFSPPKSLGLTDWFVILDTDAFQVMICFQRCWIRCEPIHGLKSYLLWKMCSLDWWGHKYQVLVILLKKKTTKTTFFLPA